jgi:hypothetical protein
MNKQGAANQVTPHSGSRIVTSQARKAMMLRQKRLRRAAGRAAKLNAAEIPR